MAIKKVGMVVDDPSSAWIAEAIASKGIDVIIVGPSMELLEKLRDGIQMILRKKLQKWLITEGEIKVSLSKVHITEDFESLSEVDMMVDCVSSSLAKKKEILARLEKFAHPKQLIVTNAAVHKVSDLVEGLSHPERVVGLHFVHHVVELIHSENTSEKMVAFAQECIRFLGKRVVPVREKAGYATTRLSMTFLNEAIAMVDEGIITPEDVDSMARFGFGFKIGPFELADRFGLDRVLLQMTDLYEETKDEKYHPPVRLQQLVQNGHLGVKTGKGFLQYDNNGIATSSKGELSNERVSY